MYVCGRERTTETQKEKRQTAGAAARGRFTVKGSERQPSGNNRSRDRKKERKTESEVGCSFLLPSFASLYQS